MNGGSRLKHPGLLGYTRMATAFDLANSIRFVHTKLRERLQEESPDAVWSSHCKDEATLEAYQSAMKTLAVDHWEKSDGRKRITWCVEQCNEYFKDGGLERALAKDKRRHEFYAKEKNKKGSYERYSQAIRLATPDHLQSKLRDETKLRLLDVGSCYNPFLSAGSRDFDVTAIDISPATDTVLRGDFLEITCAGALAEGETLSIDASRRLLSLPSQYFDVIVFCLLLSYMPSPRQRWTCCAKARELLRLNGLLLIVTPDSKHHNKNACLMKQWKGAIESIGFRRWRYIKQSHAHCMAFRTIPKPEQDEDDEGRHFDKFLNIPQDITKSSGPREAITTKNSEAMQ
ncbi:S-adenosylmethionine sensor upstream of mTORC1-like isoform X2 [Oscarella lobularis]|uniref:S-adenosylmethionine sensor upstream of mTORC1-like isoform X2 n=1 Tax=Oscarella lobularis TaxID=121494 RepID=UPI00331374CB